jgi:hypothetical protein
MKLLRKQAKSLCIFGVLALGSIAPSRAEEPAPATPGAPPATGGPALEQPAEKRLFPLFADKLRLKERKMVLPPPYGVMVLTNWLDSDWEFTSASVSLHGSPYINLPAAENATMDLQSATSGMKADVWILPFLDFMVFPIPRSGAWCAGIRSCP